MFKTFSKIDDQNAGLYFSSLLLAEALMVTRKDIFINGKDITNAILFESNSEIITLCSFPVINIIVHYLKTIPNVSLKIVGHTDNIGDDTKNLCLSAKRVRSVMNELISYYGNNPERLITEERGEQQLIADNNTPEGRAQNRRVEFMKL
jgi:outer membrane protein OmpA-like peptidoglycan-associated protein